MRAGGRGLDRLVAWSPLLFLGGLAAFTWWLDAQVRAPGPRFDGSSRHDPDLVIEGIRATELNADGMPVQQLFARRAQHYPDDGTVDIDQPRFAMQTPGEPRFTVEAERGRVTADRDNVFFYGKVRATRDGAPAKGADGEAAGPITLATEYLHVLPREERAVSDQPVTISEGRGIIRGTGLALDNRAATARLKSGLSGSIEPKALARP